MLDNLELQQVQQVDVDQDQALAQHAIPALEGDFLQRLDRRATQITLTGVLSGPTVRDGLEQLREKFRAAQPVPFVADIASATGVEQVLIESLGVRELAGKPERFEYALTLRQFTPPPAPESVPPPPAPPEPPPSPTAGTLVVDVFVEGQPEFDFSQVTLRTEGTQSDATTLARTLTNRAGNSWTEADLPPGRYTASAVVAEPLEMIGAAETEVRPGETARTSITLGATSNIATTFVVHFRFNKAFVEPCMRAVLRQAADFAKAHPDEKLLIVGHTDKVDTNQYNQSLSERRARSVFAYMTFGVDQASRDAALAEWNALRVKRPKGEQPSVKDSWGVREYQHMLQDLGFYPGAVDGDHGSLTDDAVRAFRCQHGLPPGTDVDDDVWNALILDYLRQDNLAVPKSQFFPNCTGEILKWLGCGEEDPVKNVGTAARPNRRTELMFVKAAKLPCEVPQPDTFELPEPGAVNASWCLGPGDKNKHGCFVVPAVPPPNFKPRDDQFKRVPAQPGTLTVKGSIKNEDGTPRAGQKFVLISPIGEFKAAEQSSGEPQPAVTGSGSKAGEFEFTGLPEGVYSLEVVAPVKAPVLARLDEDPDTEIKGNSVCKALTLPADGTDPERLDVVIVKAPVLREIKLPVAAHVITALNTKTHAPRPCPSTNDPLGTQASTHTDDRIAVLLNAASTIWRQARIRFEVVDTVHEFFENASRDSCTIDAPERLRLLSEAAYANAINVFFVMSLDDPEGLDEGGSGISVERGAAEGLAEVGCLVAERTPSADPLGALAIVQVLGHELGHVLNLEHVDDPDADANADQLMLPGTSDGLNRTLVADEIAIARSSQAARRECQPLKLKVTGATRIGGSLSHLHIFVRRLAAPAGGTPDVVVDAEISDKLIDPAVGSVTMSGGGDGATDRQRLVSTASTGTTTVEATYTPATGGDPTSARAVVFVSTFALRVEGQGIRQVGGDPNNIVVMRDARRNALVTVVALIDPRPFCVPDTLVDWTNGDETADPLRHTVSKNAAAQTVVSATVAGETRSVTITVIDIALVENKPPFSVRVDEVQIEGILNKDRKDIDLGDLFSTQPGSLFRARADIPGVPAATNKLQAKLISTAPGGGAIETITVELTRVSGDRFVSLPLLVVPAAIPRTDLKLKTPKTIEIIRGRAGGKLRMELSPMLADISFAEVSVRGRVVFIAAQAFKQNGTNAGVTAQDIRDHIARANRIWAQAGVEVKERSVNDSVPDPHGLLDLAHNENGVRTDDERRLLGTHPDCAVHPGRCATRSAVPTDFNVYYVRDIESSVVGLAYGGTTVLAVEGPSVTDSVLAHEIGHQILVNWACTAQPAKDQEHKDTTCTLWPKSNVMHITDEGGGEVDKTQVENILRSARFGANTNPMIIFEP